MLEKLLSTKLKKKLLGIFFAFPKRSFAIPELRELAHASERMINQALKEFIRDQVITTATRNRRRYFRINPRFALYHELADMASDKNLSEDEVSRRLRRVPNLKLIVLSGIFTGEPQLPVDLLLVGNDISRTKVEQALADLEKLVDEEINFTTMNVEEYEYRKMMSDRFIRDVLDNPHLIVIDSLKK